MNKESKYSKPGDILKQKIINYYKITINLFVLLNLYLFEY
jgi:plasmid maintenance system antidote protein VapI